MAPWTIKWAERARQQRGQGGGDFIVDKVAAALDDKDDDDGSGRQHQAITNPMMATMAAVADNDGDGG